MSSPPLESDPNLVLIPETARVHREAIAFDVGTLRRITRMAFAYRWRMALAIVGTIFAAIAQIVIPRLVGEAVDSANGMLANAALDPARTADTLFNTAILLLSVSVFRGAATMLQNYQGEAVGHLIAYELKRAFYAKLQHQSFHYHDQAHSGDLMSRGILDIEGTRLWVHTGILRMILLTILIIGGAWMLISLNLVLALLALSFVPMVAVGASWVRLKLRVLWLALQEELGVLTRVMEENLGGIRVVRSFASQGLELARFDVISKRALAILHRRIVIFVGGTTTMSFAFFLSMGLVLWIGAEKVSSGEISVGDLATFLTFMAILQMPVRQIAWMVNSIARASTCGSRLFEVLDLEADIIDRPGAVTLGAGAGLVRFEQVSFSYQHADGLLPALHDVSFEVRPGHTVGIVGPPGSGKSTIAHLIPRYYEPSAGRITIDGVDIRDATLDSLRSIVSVVQQDPFLFTADIQSNVAYGDPWADRSAIRRATEAAQLHNYIAHLPEGYETLVGERGVSLSGGQRQRLAIARGVLPDSKVIVFDDSTAAVDAATEQRIRSALSALTAQRATIIIAHRLSSLMHANEILFLDHGRIVERGSHQELIAQAGRYAQLYALQTHAIAGELSPIEAPAS